MHYPEPCFRTGQAIQSANMAAMAFSQAQKRPADPNPRLALRNSAPTSLTSPAKRSLQAKLVAPSLGSAFTELHDGGSPLSFGVHPSDKKDGYLPKASGAVDSSPPSNKKRKINADPEAEATENEAIRSQVEELGSNLFGEGTISMCDCPTRTS
jgi:hypothetical protein